MCNSANFENFLLPNRTAVFLTFRDAITPHRVPLKQLRFVAPIDEQLPLATLFAPALHTEDSVSSFTVETIEVDAVDDDDVDCTEEVHVRRLMPLNIEDEFLLKKSDLTGPTVNFESVDVLVATTVQ